MEDIHQILTKYWGHSTFRPLQEDIIKSVLQGKDTLALLPTGGGKSICFQVPALALPGVCIVISPLIALMKDQVDSLKKKGIKAAAVFSGMHRREIDYTLDNAVYGDMKLLYMSPERLETEMLRERIKKMNVSILAVDEAHCISQWGYDFRPPYLRIADIRSSLPNVPVLALTATATPEVVADIQKRLGFKSENAFRKSFLRENLIYMVFREEDKLKRLLKVASRIAGTGVVYVRNRRRTREIAEFLIKNGISADYYHAGLDGASRDSIQRNWMDGKKRIIVSTNAFGMGIDKPDVRFVVHMDLPDCVEAYFQEAGRGGRDGKRAYGVMLWEKADIIESKRNLDLAFPDLDLIRKVYQCIGNYCQLPEGSGKDVSFDFSLHAFSEQYKFPPATVFNSIKLLEREGYVRLSDGLIDPSRLMFTVSKNDLYRFQVETPAHDAFIKTILRMYSGVLSEYCRIDESDLAKKSQKKREQVVEVLVALDKLDILSYLPGSDKPRITFCTERLDTRSLGFGAEDYRMRKEKAAGRMEAMLAYVERSSKCRSQSLLEYFGESDSKRCGFCDMCIERNKLSLSELEFDMVIEKLKPLLKSGPLSIDKIMDSFGTANEANVIKVLQWLCDNDKIELREDNKYYWPG